jgi:hypothetical protein
MEFIGGFVGVRQCAKTLRLKPEIGWAVRSIESGATRRRATLRERFLRNRGRALKSD